MKTRRKYSAPPKDLRTRAERLLDGTRRQVAVMSPEEVQHTVHELQVHQVELEMQNDELRRAQLELEKARDRYADLYDFAPAALLTLSARGEILEANLGAGKLLGLERGRLVRQKFTRFVATEAQDTFYMLCQQIFDSNARQSAELALVNAQAGRLVIQLEAVRDPASLRKQFRVSFTDITERKRMEQELRESEERFRQVTGAIDQVFWMTTADKNQMLYVSPGYERIWGRTCQSLYDSPLTWLDAVHPEDRPKLIEAATTKQATGGYDMEYRIFQPGGSELWIRDRAFPVRDASGKVQRIAGIAADITERKRMEESLRRSERILTDFFNQAPIGLAWLSVSGTILRANQAQLDLLGFGEEEYLGHYFKEFCADPTGGTVLLERLAAKETIHNHRMLLRHKDGTLRHILVDAHASWSSDKFLYSSIFSRDITDRVKLEREILEVSEREHRRIAQDLHDGLGQLLAGTAYLTGTLRQKLADKSLPEARPLARIAKLLDEAITQTRGLARGLHPVKPEANGLMAALHELAAQTKILFQVRCRFACPRPVLVENNAVATHLFRIAQEAVTNAIKHGKPGRIEISLTETPERIRLAVRNDGVEKPTKRWNKKGMGLRIMQYRAGVIGASLAVQREAGGGVSVVCTAHKLNHGLITPPPREKRDGEKGLKL